MSPFALRGRPFDDTLFDAAAITVPACGEVLVRVHAAGCSMADSRELLSPTRTLAPAAWRSGVAGVVEAVGEGVSLFAKGDEVFGVTNPHLLREGERWACMSSGRLAHKPSRLGFEQAASIPTIGVTAWQMLFGSGRLDAGETVVILGADAPVGQIALQLAHASGVRTIALASMRHADPLRSLGASRVIDASPEILEAVCARAAVVVDVLGGMIQRRALLALGNGGTLVSSVSRPDASLATQANVKCLLCISEVTTVRLRQLAMFIDSRRLEVAPFVRR
jgi:NADPH:quinone reductase-like Zn-dependent oxidoreductase